MDREKGTNYELTKKLKKFSEQYYCGQNGNKYTKRVIMVNVIIIILIRRIDVIIIFVLFEIKYFLIMYYYIIFKRTAK